MSALLLLRAVTAAGLLAVADTLSVQRTADDLVTDAGEVLHTTATHEHDRVLLKVVADARDVRRHLDLAAELHTSDLAQRGVRLLGGSGVHARAHAAPLRASLQRRRLGLARLRLAALSDQLLDRGHRGSPLPSAVPHGRTVFVLPLRVGRWLVRPPRSGVSSARGPTARLSTRNGSCSVSRADSPDRAAPASIRIVSDHDRLGRTHELPGRAQARGERVPTVST